MRVILAPHRRGGIELDHIGVARRARTGIEAWLKSLPALGKSQGEPTDFERSFYLTSCI